MVRGSYDFKIDNNSIFVLPDNEKMIKLFFEGQARTRDLDAQQTSDMTFDSIVEQKVGTAFICSELCGKYTVV